MASLCGPGGRAGLESTLTALRVLDVPTARSGNASGRAGHWDTLAASAPVLVATMRRYLSQLALSCAWAPSH